MIVNDVYTQVQAVLGTCDATETYSKINEAIEELANLGNWDPLTMYMDICTKGCEITLPDDVEVPLAVNVGGVPSDFRNKWFEFHLNGPGSSCCGQACTFAWQDRGDFPVFRDPIKASQVAAYPEGPEAMGLNVKVFGYDANDKWIMTADLNGVMQDGFDVPILYGIGAGMTVAQKVKRITRVIKPITNNFLKLVAVDPGSCSGGTLLGLYRPNFTEPLFRRITISGGGCSDICNTNSTSTWVRMRVRKKVFQVSQLSDYIPLHSVTAVKLMVQAIKKYEADLLQEYGAYFQAAKTALEREQKTRSGPNQIKIQFQGTYAGSPCDNMI